MYKVIMEHNVCKGSEELLPSKGMTYLWKYIYLFKSPERKLIKFLIYATWFNVCNYIFWKKIFCLCVVHDHVWKMLYPLPNLCKTKFTIKLQKDDLPGVHKYNMFCQYDKLIAEAETQCPDQVIMLSSN